MIAPTYVRSQTVPEEAQVKEEVWTKESLIAYATVESRKGGVDPAEFVRVMTCEVYKNPDGSWDAKGQSRHPDSDGPNGREDSWGPLQINLYWNPEVTRAQAQDPYFAIPWSVNKWKQGLAHRWSCY